MNSGWIGKKGIRYWYYRYRDSEYYAMAVIAVTVIVSILLIFFVIIPEVNQWFSIRDEISATQQSISVLQGNINFINNLNKTVMNSQLQTVSQALPPNKDFGSTLDTISNAAVTSGVSLDEYSFGIGGISTGSASQDTTDTTAVDANGVSTVEITVQVNGTVDQIGKFISTIQNTLPLAEVPTIDGNDGVYTLTLDFYQKPFPELTISDDTPLAPLSSDKVNLIQKLSKWQDAVSVTSPTQTSASGSAPPLFQ